MKKLEYDVQFTTPAFLGNHNQQAEWRAPPFKTMLRQWWRILQAQKYQFSHEVLLEEEGQLFGTVNGQARQSKVKLRLLPPTGDSRVVITEGGSNDYRSLQTEMKYLGYGRVEDGNKLNAIRPTEVAKLVVITPEEYEQTIKHVLYLCDQFATIGGRAKNGWGSVQISVNQDERWTMPLYDWQQSFNYDWPHSFGSDNRGPLVWRTDRFNSWEEVMKTFHGVRKEIVNSQSGQSARAVISYPVTKNNQFGGKYRLPSQLIFKVLREGDAHVGHIYHLPHGLPDQTNDTQKLTRIWSSIHAALDDQFQR